MADNSTCGAIAERLRRIIVACPGKYEKYRVLDDEEGFVGHGCEGAKCLFCGGTGYVTVNQLEAQLYPGQEIIFKFE